MTTTTTTTPSGTTISFTGRKSQFLNMQQDGKKFRAGAFKNKKKYDRKNRSWKNDF